MLSSHVALYLLTYSLSSVNTTFNEQTKKYRPAGRLIRDLPHTAPLCHVVDAFI